MTEEFFFELPEKIHSALLSHLLPYKCKAEQAAFVFVKPTTVGGKVIFRFVEWRALAPSDFLCHSEDYLELSDHTRASLIKHAHNLGTSLVEFHSHPFSKSAVFSTIDLRGFKEFVPHVWWRLKGKPYMAVVVAPKSFDALVWIKDPIKPQKVDGIIIEQNLLYPTGITIQYLEASRGRTL